jgi:formyl-CoA transferase
MHAIGVLVPGDGIPGTGLTVSCPIQIEGEQKVRPRAAPAVGQDTDEVLREAGYADHEIAQMRAAGWAA